MHLVLCCCMLFYVGGDFFPLLFPLKCLKGCNIGGNSRQISHKYDNKANLNPNRASLFSCVCVLKLFYKTDTSSNGHHCRNSKQSNSQRLAFVNTPKTCVFNKCMNLQEGVLLASPPYLGQVTNVPFHCSQSDMHNNVRCQTLCIILKPVFATMPVKITT